MIPRKNSPIGQLPTRTMIPRTTPHQDHYQPAKPLIRTNTCTVGNCPSEKLSRRVRREVRTLFLSCSVVLDSSKWWHLPRGGGGGGGGGKKKKIKNLFLIPFCLTAQNDGTSPAKKKKKKKNPLSCSVLLDSSKWWHLPTKKKKKSLSCSVLLDSSKWWHLPSQKKKKKKKKSSFLFCVAWQLKMMAPPQQKKKKKKKNLFFVLFCLTAQYDGTAPLPPPKKNQSINQNHVPLILSWRLHRGPEWRRVCLPSSSSCSWPLVARSYGGRGRVWEAASWRSTPRRFGAPCWIRTWRNRLHQSLERVCFVCRNEENLSIDIPSQWYNYHVMRYCHYSYINIPLLLVLKANV